MGIHHIMEIIGPVRCLGFFLRWFVAVRTLLEAEKNLLCAPERGNHPLHIFGLRPSIRIYFVGTRCRGIPSIAMTSIKIQSDAGH
jgi:hypothetical protein